MTHTIPPTMRASVLHGSRDLRLEERPTPVPAEREVLVRVRAVGVCGSDTHYFTEGRIGGYVVDAPLILGHEASGVIVAVGSDVDPSRIGDLVSLEPGVPKPYSHETLTGNYNLDPKVRFFATPPVDGAFSEYVTHPAAFTYSVPTTVSETSAALLEPLSVAIAATRAARVELGSHVLVAGAGPIGLLIAAVAQLRGATRVHVFDVREERLDSAIRYGAHGATLPDNVGSERFSAFLDATGAQPAVTLGIDRLDPRGRAVLVGMGSDEITIPLPLLQGREIEVTGTFRYRNTWPLAIELAAAGAVDLDGLATSRYGLEDVESALMAGSKPDQIKAVVTP